MCENASLYCVSCPLTTLTAPGRTLSPGIAQDQTIITARVGDNATLQCFYQLDSHVYYALWYQQKLGATPRLISSSFTYEKKAQLHKDFEKDSRFSVQLAPGVNHLTITRLRLSDSATYYCGTSDMRAVEYGHGFFLHVKTPKTAKQTVIRQGWIAALLPGNSVNLSCEVTAAERCSGDHSIYWYRAGGAQPALLYGNTDVCEGHSGLRPPALKTCTFHLPMADLRAVDAGTYYCVLSLCGEILFGNGTTVDIVGKVVAVTLHCCLFCCVLARNQTLRWSNCIYFCNKTDIVP